MLAIDSASFHQTLGKQVIIADEHYIDAWIYITEYDRETIFFFTQGIPSSNTSPCN